MTKAPRLTLLAAGLLLAGIAQAATTKTETITYSDNTTKWVLGQPLTVTDVGTGLVQSSTTYDATTALPLTTSAFGKLQSTATYNANGTLATIKDGLNQTTTFSNWMRGIPQTIQYADATTQSAVVDGNGWISSVTNEVGAKTCYTYDAMGRMATVTYPSETSGGVCDTSKWAMTTRSFVAVASTEYGIPAGHWRETTTTGNATKVVYYDAQWRPLLTRQYDAANMAGTERFSKVAYDAEGRTAFASYPSTTSTPTTGVWTFYDALGRVTSTSQDSEQGLLTSTSTYNTGFTTTVTSPKFQGTGTSTTISYLTYDQPRTDWPLIITAPQSTTTTITRDVFGKPKSLTRSGGGVTPVVRDYAYNNQQELIRSQEPETGATIYGYDAAGNLAFSAAGLPLGANWSTGYPSSVTRTYDARNRLSTLNFPDGNGNQTLTYFPDGQPQQVTTANSGNTVTNTYTYNNRRLLSGESMVPDTVQTGWAMGYGYNSLGQVTTETYPASVSVSYTVNALGQTTQVTASADAGAPATVASNASYYPNGGLKQFTYGNGIVHSMIQNTRQLPSRSTDVGVLDLGTEFDANGNVAAVTDYFGSGRQTKSMVYDGLDRLTSTTSPMFGTANYTYDALDNLKRVQVTGGTQIRDQYYCYDTTGNTNRLAFVRSGPDCSSSPAVTALTYDLQGNVASKTGTAGGTYAFDFGNRLRGTAGLTYRYDAQGRRVRLDNAGASLKYSFYSQDGRLTWQRDEPSSKRISNLYLAGSLVAELSRPIGLTTVTLSYYHTDALGTPIAKTNASRTPIENSEYEPYGKLLNRANDDRAGYTGHVMDAASGLTYMQQRYYDPQIGRFLSVDPVTAISTGGASFNRYWYGSNNPYRFRDPDGREVVYANQESEELVANGRKNSKIIDGLYSTLNDSKKIWVVDFKDLNAKSQPSSQSNTNPSDPSKTGLLPDGRKNEGSGGTITVNKKQEVVAVKFVRAFLGPTTLPTKISPEEKLAHEMGHAVQQDSGTVPNGDREINGNARKVEDAYREEQGLKGTRSGVL